MKNKRRWIKVVVSTVIAVSLLCAWCLPLYAETPYYINTIDTNNNLWYSAEIDGSANTDVVYAVNAGTFVSVYDLSAPPALSRVIVTTTITMYRGGEVIGYEYATDVLDFSEHFYIDQQTAWIVPDATNPFDYVITTHTVYPDYVSLTTAYPDALLDEMYVFDYRDFLREI
ncbi:MAG: hypothetical protein IJW40_11720 [Clostridia bacterium]|nr:hypothetical protein [Clostridia bacterium]MBQ7339103.1 hypothetical protein [Clostridia bacterium]